MDGIDMTNEHVRDRVYGGVEDGQLVWCGVVW